MNSHKFYPGATDMSGDEEATMFRLNPQHTGMALTEGLHRVEGVKWKFETEGPVYSSPVVSNGTVYFGSNDGHVYAVDGKNGMFKWKTEVSTAVSSTPLVSQDRVFIVDNTGNCYCLNAVSGHKQWEFETRGAPGPLDPWDYFCSSPCLAQGSVLFGTGDGIVYALAAETGNCKWMVRCNYPVRATPAFHDGIVYVGDWGGWMHAIRCEDGKELWRFHNPEIPLDPVTAHGFTWYAGSIMSSVAVSQDRIYFGSRDFHLYALDSGTGEVIWTAKTGSWICSSPAVSPHGVFVGTSDTHTIEAFDEKTGDKLWSTDVGSNIFASPVAADGVIYGASGWALAGPAPSDWVFALDANTGRELWKVPMNAPIHATPAVYEKIVYVASTDGCLYAIS